MEGVDPVWKDTPNSVPGLRLEQVTAPPAVGVPGRGNEITHVLNGDSFARVEGQYGPPEGVTMDSDA